MGENKIITKGLVFPLPFFSSLASYWIKPKRRMDNRGTLPMDSGG